MFGNGNKIKKKIRIKLSKQFSLEILKCMGNSRHKKKLF